MDFSDTIRKAQSRAIWTNYITTNLATQPTCNYSTCGSTIAKTCVVNFKDYEQRYEVALGRQNSATCSASASTFCF